MKKIGMTLKSAMAKFASGIGFTLASASTALAAPDRGKLPTVYTATASNNNFIDTAWEVLGKGVTFGGLAISALALIVVGNVLLGEFNDLRTGKGSIQKLGVYSLVGVLIIIAIVFFVNKAMDVFA